MNKPVLKLYNKDQKLIKAMQLLGDKNRYLIFKLILTNKELCVSEIAGQLDVSIPAVSQYFKMFELVGLVERNRMGQKICYELKENDPFVKQLVEFIQTK